MKDNNSSPKAKTRSLRADEIPNDLNRPTPTSAASSVSSRRTVTSSLSAKDVCQRARLGRTVEQSEQLAARTGRPIQRGLSGVETEIRKITQDLIRRVACNRTKSHPENEYAGTQDGCPR